MCQVLTHCLLCPTLGQSDEPSDLRGSLTLLNFSDRGNADELTPYSVYKHIFVIFIHYKSRIAVAILVVVDEDDLM